MSTPLLLVGCGKMGGALLAGWLSRDLDPEAIVVVEPAGPGALPAGVHWFADAADIADDFRPQVVVLAVKPQTMAEALGAYARYVDPATVFLSIAAGPTLAFFASHLGTEAAVVRAMPNTPAAVGRGITVACPNGRVNDAQRALCDHLLAGVGAVAWIEDEALIDAVTGVSGSGPAYVFHLAECLAAAGEVAGLPPALAAQLARATVAGAGELMRVSPETPTQLRQNVTSPNGTTQAALDVLMAEDGLAPLLRRAVAAATRRSRELGE